jgi:hypothetical protein
MGRFLAVVAHEIREAIPAFLFFLAVFQLGQITRALTLDEYQITAGRTAFAAIGALIVAKAILVADALPLTKLFANRARIYSIAWTSLIYLVITSAFHYLEELIPLWRKYGGVVAAHERLLEEVSWPHFWAVQLWVAFSLLCYCTGVELIRAIGKEKAKELLFGTGARTA